MLLTTDQWNVYQEDGFLVIPNVLSNAELQRLRADIPAALAEKSPRRVLELDGRTVRGIHGQHTTFDSFARLVRHPRLLQPCRQLLGEDVYVYQFKVNQKAAFDGDVWPWHQDFIFWREEDGLPEAQLVSVAVMIDDNTEANGPVMFLAGSHREGEIDVKPSVDPDANDPQAPSWIHNLTANLKYVMHRERVRQLAQRYPVRSATAPAGSLLLFHPNVVHASSNNISPFDRCLVLVTYNSVLNRARPVPNPRPEFLASKDYRPLTPGPDSILLD